MRFFLIIAGIVVCFNISAQTILKSVEEAFVLIENHTFFRQAALQISEAQTDLRISKSALYPTLKTTANADYYLNLPVQLIPAEIFGGPSGTFQEVQFGQPWVLNTGFEFQWPVWHPEKRKEIHLNQLLVDQANVNRELQIEQLKIKIIYAYYQALLWKSLVPFSDELKVQVDLLYTAARDKMEQDLISALDYNRVEALRKQIYQQAIETGSKYRLSLVSLSEALEIASDQPIILNDNLEEAPMALPSGTPLEHLPALRLRTARETAASQFLEVKKATYWPVISLVSRYQFQWQSDDLFDRNRYIGFDFGTVGMGVQWTLFQGNSRKNQVEKARILQRQAYLQTDQTRMELSVRQQQWLTHYEDALTVFPLVHERYVLTGKSLELALQRLEEGYSPLDEYFQIYQEYNQAAIDYYQNRLNLHIYHALLQL